MDADEFGWLRATAAWGVTLLGGEEVIQSRPLILPDRFKRPKGSGHAMAEDLFSQVKQLAGMGDWPCELRAGQASRESRVAMGFGLQHHDKGPPLGTFASRGDLPVITYNPSQLSEPASLVATFAHELAHYQILSQALLPPGGRDLEEHATDLVAVMMGFGIFMANGAKTFRQFQNFGEQGWEMKTAGYLSELALVTVLALFVRLTGSDAKAAEGELKAYLRSPFRKALAAVGRDSPQAWAQLQSPDLDAWRQP